MKSESYKTFPYLVIVSLVAIVGIVVLVLSLNSPEKVMLSDETTEEALTGEALKVRQSNLQALPQCPTCLKDYEIGAFAITQSNNAAFMINGQNGLNGQYFELRGSGSSSSVSGGTFFFKSVAYQQYAGGLNGPTFHIEKICPKQYTISANGIYDNTQGNGEYDVNGEHFVLVDGETKILRDGTKIIHKSEVSQPYAGGLNGVFFELIC